MSSCAVCGGEARLRCAKCHITSYCTKDHQRDHWKTHRPNCSPYRVRENDVVGRYLEATRDIKAGEVILTDTPLVIGPRQVTIPVCLGCFTPVDGSYSCTDCGWPLCGPECQQVVLHQPECHLTKTCRSSKVQVNKFLEVNQMYECITPLRVLWQRDHDPDRWSQLTRMESHLDQRVNTDVHEVNQANVVDFAKHYLRVRQFTDKELHTACGIIDVNGFEIPGPNAIALYGKACLLEHQCIPNTTRTFDPHLNLILRAAVDITKGQHITTSYSDPMWGTANRQLHLRTTKYFKCTCERCTDASELGTHLSSLKCTKCGSGHIMPSPSALSPEAWVCASCDASLNLDQVDDFLTRTGERLINLKDGPPKVSEAFLKETSTKLSENHYYRTDVKIALAQLYGRSGDERTPHLHDLSKDLLERKEALCREVLILADKFSPGKSRLRGLLLFELQAALKEKHRRLPKKLKTSAHSKKLLQEASGACEEAREVLLYESPLQDEYQMGVQADLDLKALHTLLAKCR